MTETEGNLRLTQAPVASTTMLIRRPVAEVFDAFIDPAITTRFWFSKGSGRLIEGAQVRCDWQMFGVGADVRVRTIEDHRRIIVDWGSADDDAWTTVAWDFDPRTDDTTFVRITNSGFQGSGDDVYRQACDSTQEFSFLLAGLKAFLEHGIALRLVPDHFPDGLVEGWSESE
ncbi:SRPBCC family protein [soil metagenome]